MVSRSLILHCQPSALFRPGAGPGIDRQNDAQRGRRVIAISFEPPETREFTFSLTEKQVRKTAKSVL